MAQQSFNGRRAYKRTRPDPIGHAATLDDQGSFAIGLSDFEYRTWPVDTECSWSDGFFDVAYGMGLFMDNGGSPLLEDNRT